MTSRLRHYVHNHLTVISAQTNKLSVGLLNNTDQINRDGAVCVFEIFKSSVEIVL